MQNSMGRFQAAMGLTVAALATVGGVSTAHASVVSYNVYFDGTGESPANNSTGYGSGTVAYDNVAHTLTLNCSFSSLVGTTTASHIHAATANAFQGTSGVATTTPSFVGFPIGVQSGTFFNVLDLTLSSSYNPTYVTANGSIANAELALTSAMAAGRAYWNIHSTSVPGGEIRGWVPAPSAAALLGLGGTLVARRRRR